MIRPLSRVVLLSLLVSAPLAASAQPTWGRLHTTTLAFGPGSQSGSARNGGYDQATVTVEYKFSACNGAVYVTARSLPSTLAGDGTYWVNGQRVSVPAAAPRPAFENTDITTIPFTGAVRSGDRVIGQIDGHLWATPLHESCNLGFRVATTRELTGTDTPTAAQLSQAVPALRLSVSTSAPLKRIDIPDMIEREAAQERQRQDVAERQRQEAETQQRQEVESRQRLEAERAAPGNGRPGASGVTSTTPEPASPGTAPNTTAIQSPQTAPFIRTTDGGHYVRNDDGTYRAVSPAEYETARTQAAASQRAQADAQAEAEQARRQAEAVQQAEAQRQAAEAERQRQETTAAAAGAVAATMVGVAAAGGLSIGGSALGYSYYGDGVIVEGTGYGMGLSGSMGYLDVGMISLTYSCYFCSDEPLEGDGFYIQAGIGKEFALSGLDGVSAGPMIGGQMLLEYELEEVPTSVIFGVSMTVGPFRGRFDFGADSVGGSVYFDLFGG